MPPMGVSAAFSQNAMATYPRKFDDRRGSSAARGYDHRWRKYRESFLRKNPLCRMHAKLGQLVAATVVDHIEPHRGDSAKFWDKANHQPLCENCHNSHKQRLERGGRVVGCDLSGVPVDPNHHWAAEG